MSSACGTIARAALNFGCALGIVASLVRVRLAPPLPGATHGPDAESGARPPLAGRGDGSDGARPDVGREAAVHGLCVLIAGRAAAHASALPPMGGGR